MKLTITLCAILLMQYIFSFIQIQLYKKNMEKIVSGYRGDDGFYIFSGMEKRKLSSGAIVIIIVDNLYTIHECHIMKGVSVFSRFKELKKYKGKHVGEMVNDVNETYVEQNKRKKVSAIGKALLTAGENALLTVSKKNISIG
ncbi:MAG: transcriptional regulator GutM [Bacillota bacterium]|nr:transcriptional regulator GutM [Bacillota bacterium]